MDVELRTIGEDRFAEWVRTNELAFGSDAGDEDVERERALAELDRTFGAFDGEELIGTAASYSLRMRVPGGSVVPTAGVTMVGVKPTHRRRGVNTAMMRRLLDQAAERGEPLAALFASEGGIYGRFGFGVATYIGTMDLETARSAYVRGYRPSGRTRLRSVDEALPTLIDVYERASVGRPGSVALDERRFRYWLHTHGTTKDQPFFVALHEDPKGPDAYAIYKVKHEWSGGIPRSELAVHDVQATTPQAYADVWRFVLDVDLVHHVTAWARPIDEPLLELLAEPRRLRLTVRDGLWVRPVDVAAALAARGYAAPGRLVLEVEDPFRPENEGRVALEAGEGSATCVPTDEEPDIACSVNVLGAVHLGGTTFRRLWRANRVVERRPGALALADAMFATDTAPWCPFVF